MWHGCRGITFFSLIPWGSLDTAKEIKKQGLLDRQIWYVAWAPWGNLVSLFIGNSEDLSKELEKRSLLDRQIWYVAWVPWDNRISLIPWGVLG